jgi:putative oxidoreductase
MGVIVLIGRILFSFLFIIASLGHFSKAAIDFAASQGVAMPQIAVPLSGIIALIGGLSILFGYKARFGAWLIVIFLIPVTAFMHQFWKSVDPAIQALDQAMFLKNLALIGAALLIAYFGAGPVSIDHKKEKKIS